MALIEVQCHLKGVVCLLRETLCAFVELAHSKQGLLLQSIHHPLNDVFVVKLNFVKDAENVNLFTFARVTPHRRMDG